jgi:glycine dehydrogenase subunit 1
MVGHRFLPTTDCEKKEMLASCGVSSIEDLLQGIPKAVRFVGDLNQDEALSEMEIKRKIFHFTKESRMKNAFLSFLGAGSYDHFCPAVVNQLTLRGEFLTSYTPYQPEYSQGTLQSLFEFQTMIAEIFGMDVSTASHYDGATSLAEAALMALRLSPNKKKILISAGVHPEYRQVLKTYVTNLGVEIVEIPFLKDTTTTSEAALKNLLEAHASVALVIVQSPNFYGCLENMENLCALAQSQGALFSVNITEPLSLALLKTPGDYGADFATGEGQSFGLPQSFGGPYLGLFTARLKYVRQVPGRLCGESVDALGRRSYTLTLNTREQHIRREKATSNICTNQNLCALWATVWLALVGRQGFVELAEQNLAKTEYAKEQFLKTGKVFLRNNDVKTFNEFVVDLKVPTKTFIQACVKLGVAPGLSLERFFPEDKYGLLVCVTEKKTRGEIDFLVDLLKKFG